MTDGLKKVMKPVRRRRLFLYTVTGIIVAGLSISVTSQILVLGLVEQALYTTLGGAFLILAAIMFLYLQFLDLRRAELVAKLALKHNGTMRMEYITEELWLPTNKARSVMQFFVKRKLALTRKEGERWTFPDLQTRK
ncbi:MAG: hypothetical protein ACFE89_02535 [Candidatus Hodarchaeota archaeon]